MKKWVVLCLLLGLSAAPARHAEAQGFNFVQFGCALSGTWNSQVVNLGSGSGCIAGQLPLANLATVSNDVLLGNQSGTSASPGQLSPAAALAVLNSASCNAQTTNYTAVASDQNGCITESCTSICNVTIPLHATAAICVGCTLTLITLGTGASGFTPAASVHLYSGQLNGGTSASVEVSGQYNIVQVKQLTQDTWVVYQTQNQFTVTFDIAPGANVGDCLGIQNTQPALIVDSVHASFGPYAGGCAVTDPNAHPYQDNNGPTITEGTCTLSATADDADGAITFTGAGNCTLSFGASWSNLPNCALGALQYAATADAHFNGLPTQNSFVLTANGAGSWMYHCGQ
jgi:hypothetical protein